MSSPLLRSNLPDLYLSTALPWLEYVIQEKLKGFESKYDKIFNVKDMAHGIAQTSMVSALNAASQVGEGEIIPSQQVAQGYDKTYIALKYGIMLPTSQEAIDDQKWDVFSKNPERLARSFMTTTEVLAAAIFNEGFATVGPDGKVLFATDHPLLKPAPSAAASSNKLAVAADLSMTSLKDMATLFRKQLDTAGNKLNISPKYLLVPSELEFTAHELLKSVMLVDSANANVNAVNSIKSTRSLEPMVWDYLTDADAWFMVSDPVDHELNYFWRKRPEVSSEIDFKSEVALTKMVGRMVAGYSDWRGVCGTEGA